MTENNLFKGYTTKENRDIKDDFGEKRKRIDIFFRFLSSFEVLDH